MRMMANQAKWSGGCRAIGGLAVIAFMASLAQAATPAPATDIINRLGWGVSAGDLDTPLSGERWIDQQLKMPADTPLPARAQAQIDAMQISQRPFADIVVDLDAQLRAANALTDPGQKDAARKAHNEARNAILREVKTRDVLRDLYAPDQLRERMIWFWLNHFNIFASKDNIAPMAGDYEEQAIRPHALGRYRDLLEATLRHPAMLKYLDNAQNANGHINENYAREIMELHSMGVGSGYSQKDVQELARILTGVGVDLKHDDPRLKPAFQPLLLRAGLFEFNPARHDFGDKVFLGHAIKGSGFDEVEQALDLIAESPATAHHVSERLAAYFVGETPPPALVQHMAATFRSSHGDIAAVLKAMFRSPEFRASQGQVFKDPVSYVLSAVRMAYGERVIDNPGSVVNWIDRLGEGFYKHETPDGYSLAASAWSGPGQMAARFDFARQLGNGQVGLAKATDPTVRVPPTVPQVKDTRLFGLLQPSLSAPTQAALAQAASPREWNAFFFSSPEFMRR
jgi:uncharacterized protein (DUF1800 family)